MPPGEIQFPLLSAYLKVNDTLEGRKAARERDRQVEKEKDDVESSRQLLAAGDDPAGGDIPSAGGDVPSAGGATIVSDAMKGILQEAIDDAVTSNADATKATQSSQQLPADDPSQGLRDKPPPFLRLTPTETSGRNQAAEIATAVLADADENKRPILEHEVLAVLQTWAFRRNDKRVNVMKEGVPWVHSDTLGLVKFQVGGFCVSGATVQWPSVTRLLTRWMRDHCPAEVGEVFHCTSISVNKNYAGRLHRDTGNVALASSWLWANLQEAR